MADPRVNEADEDMGNDEELRQAIALSLGCDPQEWRRKNVRQVIDLTEDSDSSGQGGSGGDPKDNEDDDLVIVDSGNASKAKPVSRQEAAAAATSAAGEQTAPSTSFFSALGMDRKKMEEERLARLHKRKVSQVDVGDGDDVQLPNRPAQRQKIAGEGPPSSGEKKSTVPKVVPSSATSSSAPVDTNSAAPEAAASASSSRPPLVLPFPHGVVKKTWAYQQPRQGDDIKIEEVLQKNDLKLAVVSSFQWDEHWMLSKIDITRTKLMLIAFAASDAQKAEMRANVPGNKIQFCFPPMHGIGAMHSKLMLLKYEGYMRIVVPTGNFMSYDWGETGTMENMVFIIDLPKFETAEQKEAQKPDPFSTELFYFLRAQGLDQKLVSSLRNYDFTEARRYKFVHTIPGSHTDKDAWSRTGYCGLGQAVSGLIRVTRDPIDIDYVCASLGAINYDFLSAMYYACLGEPLLEYQARTGSKGQREPFNDRAKFLVKEHMRVFFPSRETVLQSKGGKEGAGTICFKPMWWQAPNFPQQILRDCKSVRPGVLMHSKVIYIRPNDPSIRWNQCLAYVGSANLSESAWGKLVRDRDTKLPKLTCRNWECGVLIHISDPPSHSSEAELIARHAAPGDVTYTDRLAAPHAARGPGGQGLGDFEGALPVPMEWPGRVICQEAADTDAGWPWLFQVG